MITLYAGPLSLFSRKVEIALAEKALPFERVSVPFGQTAGYAPKHPDVLRRNPKAEVPVLVDGDLSLFDSTLILEYLEDAYPAPPLYPRAAAAKARCRLVELTADEILLPIVAKLMYRTEPPAADPAIGAERDRHGAAAEAAIADHYRDLDATLSTRQWLSGDYSVADIAMFMTVLFALRLGGPTLAAYPDLMRWHREMLARPPVAAVSEEIARADRELALR